MLKTFSNRDFLSIFLRSSVAIINSYNLENVDIKVKNTWIIYIPIPIDIDVVEYFFYFLIREIWLKRPISSKHQLILRQLPIIILI